jgi:phosphoglycolate phosphatase-like HAD superfamily hydrolase
MPSPKELEELRAKAQQLVDDGSLEPEDEDRLIRGLASKGIAIRPRGNAVEQDAGAGDAVEQDAGEYENPYEPQDPSDAGVPQPKEPIPGGVPEVGKSSLGRAAVVAAKAEDRLSNVDSALQGKSQTGRPALYADPVYTGEGEHQMSVMNRPYLHYEPTVNNLLDLQKRVLEVEDDPIARHVATERYKQLLENGKDSDAYKELADQQWMAVRQAFAQKKLPAQRVAFADAFGPGGYSQMMGQITGHITGPALSGYDKFGQLGAGQQLSGILDNAAPIQHVLGSEWTQAKELTNKLGDLTGLWHGDPVRNPFDDIEEGDKVIRELRESGVLPLHAGDEYDQISETSPFISGAFGIGSLLNPSNAMAGIGKAAAKAVKWAEPLGRAAGAAVPWFMRGIRPALIKAGITGGLAGLGTGAATEGVEALGEYSRHEPTDFAREAAARAPSDVLMGSGLGTALEGLGAVGQGMQKELRDMPGAGTDIRNLEAAGGRLGVLTTKPSPEGRAAIDEAERGYPVDGLRDRMNRRYSTKLRLEGEDVLANKAAGGIQKELGADEKYAHARAGYDNELYYQGEGKEPITVTPPFRVMREVIQDRENAPFAESTLFKRAASKLSEFHEADVASVGMELERLGHSDAFVVTYDKAMKTFPDQADTFKGMVRRRVAEILAENPESSIPAARELAKDDLRIVVSPGKLNAQDIDQATWALDRQIRYDSKNSSVDPEVKRMAAALREMRDKFDQRAGRKVGDPRGWRAIKERHHEMLDRLDDGKRAVGLEGQDIGEGSRKKLETIVTHLRRYQDRGNLLSDEDLVRVLEQRPDIQKTLTQLAGLRAYNRLTGGDVFSAPRDIGAGKLRTVSAMRRGADPIFGAMGKLRSRPTTGAVASHVRADDTAAFITNTGAHAKDGLISILRSLIRGVGEEFNKSAPRPQIIIQPDTEKDDRYEP